MVKKYKNVFKAIYSISGILGYVSFGLIYLMASTGYLGEPPTEPGFTVFMLVNSISYSIVWGVSIHSKRKYRSDVFGQILKGESLSDDRTMEFKNLND